MKNRKKIKSNLFVLNFLIFCFILSSLILPLYANKNNIKIWLKIFHKRDKIIIENKNGFYINNDLLKKCKKLIIKRKGKALYGNNKIFNIINIQPVKNSATAFITKFGKKNYKGSFSIRLRKNHIFIVNDISFKTYLYGVVGAELGEAFHIETLKAQAVLSRTYFLSCCNKFKSLNVDACDVDGNFQVYKGIDQTGLKVNKAVKQTMNEIITRAEGNFVPYFHSTCGGMLLHPDEAWGNNKIIQRERFRRYDGNKNKPNCINSPYFKWSCRIKKNKIFNALCSQLSLSEKILRLEFNFKQKKFIKSVKLILRHKEIVIRGNEFKAYLEREGISGVKSIRATIIEKGKYYYFKGKGFGHLTGMCQWGAEYLAKQGLNYREILKYYFPESYIIVK